jgi:MFS superfamily sulfate permease-like transporter
MFDYWRLLTLVLFLVTMALLYQGVDWLFDEVLPRSATVFVAGMVAGGFLTLIVLRLDPKAERPNEPHP